jgi:hypothetical protein
MAKTKLAGRIRLDRERILDAAEAITRREGIDKLTLRRIGTELGADPTAVYRHNLSGLRGAMALLPADEFPRTRAAAPYLFGDMDDAFDRATDAILDAIERAAAVARG